MPPEKGNLCSHGNIGACIVGIGFFFFFGGGGGILHYSKYKKESQQT